MKEHAEHIEQYMTDLGNAMCEYMRSGSPSRYYKDIDGMAQCWLTLKKLKHKMYSGMTFTEEDAKKWASYMVNDDGTTGAHWTIDQTTSVAQSMGIVFEHITEVDWWICINSMYSDYYKVAAKHGVDTADFYGDMAKAFLFDPDGPKPKEKLAAYYNYIAKP